MPRTSLLVPFLLVFGACTTDSGDTSAPDLRDSSPPKDSTPPTDSQDSAPPDDTQDTASPEDTALEPTVLEVQRGDIVLWGRPLVEMGEEGFAWQAQIMFCEYAASYSDVLAPFWDHVDSFNGSEAPLGTAYFWDGLTVAGADGELTNEEGRVPLQLRPTEAWLEALDIDQLVGRATTPIERYNQPIIGLATRWFQDVETPLAWLWVNGGAEHWATIFGIDLTTLPTVQALQYSPALGTDAATDFNDEAFWDRDADEASRAAWAVLWAWYQGGNTAIRDRLLGDEAAVAAVDAISLGQLAWWLTEEGLVEVVGHQPTAKISVRHGAKSAWASSTWATFPLELDLRGETDGVTGMATLRFRCDEDGEVVAEQEAELPTSVELAAVCSYDRAGRYHPTLEVLQDGAVVTEDYTTVAVVPETLSLEIGDFALWGYPGLDQTDHRYEEELYKAFFAVAAADAAVHDAYWGGPLDSYDGSVEPVGERYMWGHIEVVTQTGDYTLMEDTVVLRPTDKMRALVDIEVMGAWEERPEYGYARPYLGTIIDWVHYGSSEIDWMSEQDDLFERWSAVYGIDFSTTALPEAVVWSPVYDEVAHTDIASEAFWERDQHCAARATWNMVYGAYAKQGESVREQLLGDWEAVEAIDTVTPGQLAWWLVDSGMAEIVLIASDPDFAGPSPDPLTERPSRPRASPWG